MYDCMVVFNLTLLGRMGGKSGWMVLPQGTAGEICNRAGTRNQHFVIQSWNVMIRPWPGFSPQTWTTIGYIPLSNRRAYWQGQQLFWPCVEGFSFSCPFLGGGLVSGTCLGMPVSAILQGFSFWGVEKLQRPDERTAPPVEIGTAVPSVLRGNVMPSERAAVTSSPGATPVGPCAGPANDEEPAGPCADLRTVRSLPDHALDLRTVRSLPDHALDPRTARSLPDHALDPRTARSLPDHALDPRTVRSLPDHALDPRTVRSLPDHALDPRTVRSLPDHALDPRTVRSLPEPALDPRTVRSLPDHALDLRQWGGKNASSWCRRPAEWVAPDSRTWILEFMVASNDWMLLRLTPRGRDRPGTRSWLLRLGLVLFWKAARRWSWDCSGVSGAVFSFLKGNDALFFGFLCLGLLLRLHDAVDLP